ncbi:hypothetical protein HZZ13_25860 [Bradyrhizobium sp. CNPSo 4010]|uniref:Uncharacterized protein n=1 Tax=Bradyrhizobium agreste TaxID=2751811 RepID=A0ABS0PVF9_9BRAD|nr:hypothetical protein [Bradyrhizobium agreste]MBH5401183.1 hypothetical protein [Bradyrhizobium agreste]
MAPTRENREAAERRAALQVQTSLASHLPNCRIELGQSLLYKIEVAPSGEVSHRDGDSPMRGQYAFQTDVLISKPCGSPKQMVPLVVIELKATSFSSHDVVLYSAKAAKHKAIYPYLRYGFVVIGLEALGRRFLIHNEGFDFAMAVPDAAAIETALVPLVRRQLKSAQRLVSLTSSGRIQLRRYEETIDIEA